MRLSQQTKTNWIKK